MEAEELCKHGGDRRTHRHADNGIGKGGEDGLKLRDILEGGNCGGHGIHADKQQAQAQHNLAHRFFVAAPDEHIEDDADNCQNGTQKRGLEEEHQYIV